jgi:hypothetical protein
MNAMTKPPKPMMASPKMKSSLTDVLGSGMNEKLKLKQIMNKHMGYEKPKPQTNNGMRGPLGEVFL